MCAWDPAHIEMRAWLEDPETGTVIPNTEIRCPIPATVLKGEETKIDLAPPSIWPTGEYNLRLDMARDGTDFRAVDDVRPKMCVKG
jgi:hypothetical protein